MILDNPEIANHFRNLFESYYSNPKRNSDNVSYQDQSIHDSWCAYVAGIIDASEYLERKE